MKTYESLCKSTQPFVEGASQTRGEMGAQELDACEQAWVDGCKDRGDSRAQDTDAASS